MKKILYTLVLPLFLVSCGEDYLETTPESSADTSTVFATTDNAALAINGICKMMAQQYLGTQGFNGEGTIKTWFGNYPGNDFQKCNLPGWASVINSLYHERPTSTYCYYPWYYYYKLIGNSNTVIHSVDQATGTEADKQFIKAQALTFRAYSYFMLSQLYCYRWVDSNNGASRGLPLRIDLSSGELAPSTLGQVYEQVYADLDEAIRLYDQSGLDRLKNDNFSPNIDVAHAIYARAALTREDWSTAATHAAKARANYPLMSNDEYMGGFNEPNQEWIWSVYGATDQQLHYYSYHAYQASNSSSSNCRNYPCAISKELINLIPESDIRRELYLIPGENEMDYTTSTGVATKGNLFKRAKSEYADWIYSTSKIFAYMQFKIRVADSNHQPGVGHVNNFRSAEMYLIEAEADCHLNKENEARQLLLALNRDSGRNPEYTCDKSGDDLLTEVKLYRRFDLWGEGFDYFDYKRWNEPIVRHAHPQGSFLSNFAVTIQPGDNNKWTWLYPDKEVNYNDALESN